ncbi:MAG: hypothetical protein ACXVCY_07785 [Pseudobdellovibrionaceae bacterium]
MSFKYLLGIACLVLTLTAKATQVKEPQFKGNTDGIANAVSVPYSQEDYSKEMSAAQKRAGRSIAAAANYEAAMSEKLKKLRADILSVKTADELDRKINALSLDYDIIDKSDIANGVTKKSPYKGDDRDYRYYAAQMIPLQCLKGIVWKFTPLAEKSGVIESRLVSTVFRLSQSMQILTPQVDDILSEEARSQSKEKNESNISKSIFDYLTQPYDAAVLFTEGYDLQDYMMNSCYSALRKSAERIERLDLTTPVVWDNKMYFGVGTFPDDLDRYKLIGEAERHFSLAMKNAGMHFISFFRAYSIDGFFKMRTEIGKLYVQDEFPSIFSQGFQSIDGVTLQKKTSVINNYTDTFVLYADGANYLTNFSWPHLVRAIQELNLTWTEVMDKPENLRMVLNPGFLTGFHRGVDETLKTWLRVIDGKAALHSRLTDRTVLFDLHNFYVHPVKDLKLFLPTKFDTASEKMLDNKFRTFMAEEGNKKPSKAPSKFHKYRNWYHGEPMKWNLASWQILFPELSSDKEIPLFLRTMDQSWGGSFMALPLMQFVR